jgi:hypothetical protein
MQLTLNWSKTGHFAGSATALTGRPYSPDQYELWIKLLQISVRLDDK